MTLLRALLSGFVLLAASCAAPVTPVASAGAGQRVPDHRDYGRAYSDIWVAIRDENFEALERMHRELAPERTKDGTWMVGAFEEVFEGDFRTATPAQLDKLFGDWKAKAPDSALRPIAEAYSLQVHAWNTRGWGCRSHGGALARRAFDSLIRRAAAAVREGEAKGKASPLWYTVALLVAGSQGRPAAELDAILDEGARRFPLYEPLYAARMTFDLPEWGGDFEQVDRFVHQAVERTRKEEGTAFYGWLYVDLARAWTCESLFDESLVSWNDMKPAFEDMLERHPDVWNRNVFATFACRARYVETTKRLLAELGKEAQLGFASTSITNETCYRMIRPEAPPKRVSLAHGTLHD